MKTTNSPKNKKRFIDYQERLMERLQDSELAIEYLNESAQDEDQRVFLLALKDVIQMHFSFKK